MYIYIIVIIIIIIIYIYRYVSTIDSSLHLHSNSAAKNGTSLGSGAASFHGELQVGVAEGLRGVSVVSLGFNHRISPASRTSAEGTTGSNWD